MLADINMIKPNALTLLMTLSLTISASEIAHYEDSLKITYSETLYKYTEKQLTHSDYRSISLYRDLEEHRKGKVEDPGGFNISFGLFNLIRDQKVTSIETWASSVRDLHKYNVEKHRWKSREFESGVLGESAYYIAYLWPEDKSNKLQSIEYRIAHYFDGKMVSVQVSYHGDFLNTDAILDFYSELNVLLANTKYNGKPVFSKKIPMLANIDKIRVGN